VTDADQRHTPTDRAAAAEPGSAGSGDTPVAVAPAAPPVPAAGAAVSPGPPEEEPNPYAPPQENVPLPPNPLGPPPTQPYGQVKPGPVQPWGAQRPREPERPAGSGGGNWGDPQRPGQIQPPNRNDPDRQYRDQREVNKGDRPAQPQRDMPTRWALGLALGALICTMLAIYQGPATFPAWMVGAGAGLALSTGACVMAIRAQMAGSRVGKRASEATMALVSACLSGALALMLLVMSIVWYSQLKNYATCMQAANTQTAQTQCLTTLEDKTGMNAK
jgi:hypothetical protein